MFILQNGFDGEPTWPIAVADEIATLLKYIIDGSQNVPKQIYVTDERQRTVKLDKEGQLIITHEEDLKSTNLYVREGARTYYIRYITKLEATPDVTT